MAISSVISVALSDIPSDILSDIPSDIYYEKPAACAKIGLLCYMEQIGSGVRFMLDETKRMELPAPQFREMSEFIVTFQKAQALRTPEPQPHYREETLWEDNEDSHLEIVVQNRHAEQIENRLIKALNYVQEHGFITNGIYRQLTGVTDRTAHRDLEKLVERGRLKGTGQRAARRYVLA